MKEVFKQITTPGQNLYADVIALDPEKLASYLEKINNQHSADIIRVCLLAENNKAEIAKLTQEVESLKAIITVSITHSRGVTENPDGSITYRGVVWRYGII